ncbi:MAG: hypothetical protein U9Q22_08665 [Candidatus Altiarchaeota archaeon]|nr:hypothetical protein [Candidatus Altiarchaeota archaeon]
MKMETTLTLKFKGVEARILDEMMKSGIFNTKSEAIRSALVKYAMDLGLFNRKRIWEEITSHKTREVSPDQLQKEIEEIKDEI